MIDIQPRISNVTLYPKLINAKQEGTSFIRGTTFQFCVETQQDTQDANVKHLL